MENCPKYRKIDLRKPPGWSRLFPTKERGSADAKLAIIGGILVVGILYFAGCKPKSPIGHWLLTAGNPGAQTKTEQVETQKTQTTQTGSNYVYGPGISGDFNLLFHLGKTFLTCLVDSSNPQCHQ